MNLTLGEIEIGVSFVLDQMDINIMYQLQLEQRIGVIKVNSIDCQSAFGESILRLAENKMVSVLVGLKVGAVFDYNKSIGNITNMAFN